MRMVRYQTSANIPTSASLHQHEHEGDRVQSEDGDVKLDTRLRRSARFSAWWPEPSPARWRRSARCSFLTADGRSTPGRP